MDIFRKFDSSRTYWSQTTSYYLIYLLCDFKEVERDNTQKFDLFFLVGRDGCLYKLTINVISCHTCIYENIDILTY